MKHTIKAGENKFYIGDDPQSPLAEIHFVATGDKELNVDHTYVSDQLRGQGVGDALVEHMVAYARQQGKKIIPTCPFVKNRIERRDDFKDVLA